MRSALLGQGVVSKVAIAAAGLVVGGVLAGTVAAQAAGTPAPTSSSSAATTGAAEDAHPGDNGADGVPEAQEHHGPGARHGLPMSGAVTSVGTGSVTIKTSNGTTTYTVTSTSDIDKNGEASLSDLAVGDTVTFSVTGTKNDQIDKLHAGNEAKDGPQVGQSESSSAGSGESATTSGASYSA